MKKLTALFTAILLVLTLTAGCCEKKADEGEVATETENTEDVTDVTDLWTEVTEAVITMESGDTIKLYLYPEKAPITVENFVTLAKEGFYDGLTFHRIIEGFMIQGGDPLGDGTGGPGHTIKGEFEANGVKNDLKHVRGVISMARNSMSYDSAGSQFFIMHADAPHLDGQYAAFGKVVEGMEVVDRIASVETDENDRPLEPQVIKTIEIIEYN